MRRLSRAGKKWVKEVWTAADEMAHQDLPISSLAAATADGIVQSNGATQESDADHAHLARLGVIRVGYATRVVLAGSGEQPSADPMWFGLADDRAIEPAPSDSAAVSQVVDTVRRIARIQFASAMTLLDEVWAAYVATATRELQGSQASGSVSWRELSPDVIDELLRWGYLLRCLDEALSAG
jgi:hypothetical protein